MSPYQTSNCLFTVFANIDTISKCPHAIKEPWYRFFLNGIYRIKREVGHPIFPPVIGHWNTISCIGIVFGEYMLHFVYQRLPPPPISRFFNFKD